jgi:glycosyltransferase involved in cell wall biosynthesis
MSMRILQIAPRYAPAWAYGGGVRMTFELALQWVARGHSVTAFTSDQDDGGRRFDSLSERIEGIAVRRFRNPVGALARRFPFLFFYPRGMKAELRDIRGRFDVIHLAESRGPHNRWAIREGLRQGVPVAWSPYGGLAEGEGMRRVYRRAHDLVFDTRGIVMSSPGLIAQTFHEAETFRRFGALASQVRVIPLAVNWAEFETLPARGQFRRSLGIDNECKLVVSVGRIHKTKGLHVLIPAFARAVAADPSARLAIVGWDQGYLANARRIVDVLGLSGRVLFPGPVYGPARLSVYVDADLFALTPGVYEETSLAALEACASGTGCVVTRQCEIPGLDEAGAGLTVACGVDEVAAAMAEVLAGVTSQKWGANARRMVRDRFTSVVVAGLHEDFFRELMERQAGAGPGP